MTTNRYDQFTPYLSTRSPDYPVVPASSRVQEYSSAVDRFTVFVPSRASNAADSIVPIAGPLDVSISVLSARMIPQASQVGSATNFDNVVIFNASTDGTGTASLASRSFSAAGQGLAIGSSGSFGLAASTSVPAGQGLAASYTSQGNGIAIQAHTLEVAYRRI